MRICAASLPALTAVLASLSLVASGCGGGGTSVGDFKAKFAPLDRQYQGLGTELSGDLTSASGKTDVQLATNLQGIQTRFQALDDQLAKISPPDKVKNDYKLLNASLARVSDDLTRLVGAVRSHNSTTARADTITLIQDSSGVKAVGNRVRGAVGLPLH